MSFILTPTNHSYATPWGANTSQRLLEEIATWRNGEESSGWAAHLGRRIVAEMALPIFTVALLVESVVRFALGLVISLLAALVDPENDCLLGIKAGTAEAGTQGLMVIPNALAALITNIYRKEI